MISIATFLIAKEVLPKNVAPVALFTFLVIPAVLSTMAFHSLYLEIAFVCYFTTTLFMVIKASKDRCLFYCLHVTVPVDKI